MVQFQQDQRGAMLTPLAFIAKYWRWLIGPALFFIHAIAVSVFPFFFPGFAQDDFGSIIWLVWEYIDWPLGTLSIAVADEAKSDSAAAVLIIFIGGTQWLIWGTLISLILYFFKRA